MISVGLADSIKSEHRRSRALPDHCAQARVSGDAVHRRRVPRRACGRDRVDDRAGKAAPRAGSPSSRHGQARDRARRRARPARCRGGSLGGTSNPRAPRTSNARPAVAARRSSRELRSQRSSCRQRRLTLPSSPGSPSPTRASPRRSRFWSSTTCASCYRCWRSWRSCCSRESAPIPGFARGEHGCNGAGRSCWQASSCSSGVSCWYLAASAWSTIESDDARPSGAESLSRPSLGFSQWPRIGNSHSPCSASRR